jgi:hypothetical protein
MLSPVVYEKLHTDKTKAGLTLTNSVHDEGEISPGRRCGKASFAPSDIRMGTTKMCSNSFGRATHRTARD